MQPDLALTLVADFERGLLSRRQLAARLMGLGATLAAASGTATAAAQQGDQATFKATGLNHVALNVTSVPKSRDFYIKHLGLKVLRESGEDNCFMGSGEGFFLTLFHRDKPGLNHYCYTIGDYNADRDEQKLKAAGLNPKREDNRLYFPDIDGIQVQIEGA